VYYYCIIQSTKHVNNNKVAIINQRMRSAIIKSQEIPDYEIDLIYYLFSTIHSFTESDVLKHVMLNLRLVP
jgi:hypothetical protein